MTAGMVGGGGRGRDQFGWGKDSSDKGNNRWSRQLMTQSGRSMLPTLRVSPNIRK